MSACEEKLLEKLNEDEKILFQRYTVAQEEINRLTVVGNLIYGYKLGLTMTAEAFIGMNDLIFDGEGR